MDSQENTLNIGILLRLSKLDEAQLNIVAFCPSREFMASINRCISSRLSYACGSFHPHKVSSNRKKLLPALFFCWVKINFERFVSMLHWTTSLHPWIRQFTLQNPFNELVDDLLYSHNNPRLTSNNSIPSKLPTKE